MRTRLTISIAMAVTLLLSSVPLIAQSTTRDWSNLKAVASGSKLEVKLKNGNKVKGTLSSVSDTALSLSVKNKPMDLQRDDVLSVYQSSKQSTTTPTLIGMGVGAGAGAAIGAVGAKKDDGGFDKIDHAVTAGLAVVGAGAGALAGYFIGRSSAKRVLVYSVK